jgi:sortase A
VRGGALAAPPGYLTGGRSRRRILRRAIRDIASVLIVSGLLLLADAAVTLLWQEPLTAVVALIKRGEIDQRLLSYRTAPLSAVQRRALDSITSARARAAFLARREQHQLARGEAVGRIMIGRLGLGFVVVQGTDEASLEKGPGHYPSSALPGLGQTVAIAGHRTTYLAPFRHLDALRAGDRIVLVMPYGRFVYSVQYHRIVPPTAWSIVRDAGYDRLVLSACNPLYSAAERIAVFARLASFHPLAG